MNALEQAREERQRAFLHEYVERVRRDWLSYWSERHDHPYSRFATFLGERIQTDFDLRERS